MNVIIFGAGSIGRGFIGQLMFRSGFDITLVDVNDELLNKLREKGYYTLELISNECKEVEQIKVQNVINGQDIDAVSKAVSNADIIFTAVGVGALKYIAKPIAMGLKKRQEHHNSPVNIILCENLINANDTFKELIKLYLEKDSNVINNIGFIRASVGRMVPLPESGTDLLVVKAEPYYHLPIDSDGIVGKLPEFLGLERVSPFDYAMKRKLYIHNLGHAASAWLGAQHGYKYIYEAIGDQKIRSMVQQAMNEAAMGLCEQYGRNKEELDKHIKDLLSRFANKELGDTVSRVGRDTLRKLGPDDRALGALHLCQKYYLPYKAIAHVIVAGLKFTNDDEGTNIVHQMIRSNGIIATLDKVCGIADKELAKYVDKLYRL